MSAFLGFACGFLLSTLHFFFTLCLHLKLLKLAFMKLVDNIGYLFMDRNRKFKLDSAQITSSLKGYSKIPKHLTFALGNECLTYDDLIQIILWTLPTGITNLSFYDHKNGIDANKLYNAFCKYHHHLLPSIRWGVSFSKKHKDANDYNARTPCLQVNILTSKHGRQLLIDSIKEICQRKDITLTDRATTEATLDDVMLSKLSHCHNPDFMVINGNFYTTYGLSPWHLTFTEFLTIPSYRLLTTTDYINLLANFSSCEQKFGR